MRRQYAGKPEGGEREIGGREAIAGRPVAGFYANPRPSGHDRAGPARLVARSRRRIWQRAVGRTDVQSLVDADAARPRIVVDAGYDGAARERAGLGIPQRQTAVRCISRMTRLRPTCSPASTRSLRTRGLPSV